MNVHSTSFMQIKKKSMAEKAEATAETGLIEAATGPSTDKIMLKEVYALPDIRIPAFDKSKCKEGEDVFMCMTDHLAKHYNRIKCDKRLRNAYYAKYLYPEDEKYKDRSIFEPIC